MRNMPSRQHINFAFTYKNHWGDEQIYIFGVSISISRNDNINGINLSAPYAHFDN